MARLRERMPMEPTASTNSPKPSKIEAVKIASEYLKTFVADELSNGLDHFSDDAAAILKFHGSYQQDDRDLRTRLKREKKEKAYQLMVRVRVVGGKLTADQFLACHELARTLGNGTLRITTRQEFQLHGVLKSSLAAAIRQINESLLSTLAACGDVERNVLCCPAPIHDALRDQLQDDARRWAAHAAPRSSSYWEIWLDGEKIETLPSPGPSQVPAAADDAVEPLYGKAYLPRKFKTAFAFPEDNCTDIHANDLGFLAIVEDSRIVGYNVLVGGGLGTTPSAQKTFPFLAVPLCYVDRQQTLAIGEAVLKVFRDFGNRSDRKRARIKDEGTFRLFSGLRAFFDRYRVPARLTCQQSILLADLDPAWRQEINAWLEEYGIATVERISKVRRWAMACPALPTCGLAVTEAERALPSILDDLESELARLGLAQERLTVRMTGCPNGCARPYNADIGLVGRSAHIGPDGKPGPGTYTIFLGGRTIGDRLNLEFKDYVPHDQVVPVLVPVFQRFQSQRQNGETFGEFCARLGVEELAGPHDR